MSRDAERENSAVIKKLTRMYRFRPFLWGTGVSRKTERPYSDMKRFTPGAIVSILPIPPMVYGSAYQLPPW
jgi:hypothetical protein